MENTQNIMIKRLAALMVVVVVVFCVTIPCSAYTDNSENGIDFSEQPIPETQLTSNSYTDGFNLLEYGNALYYSASSNSDSVYLFAAPSSGIYAWYAVALSNTDNIHTFTYNTNTQAVNQISGATGTISNSTYYNDYNLYYKECGYYNTSLSGTTVNIPVFTSISDGLSAVRDWIDNPDTPSTSQPLSLALQPGNVAYIDITNTNATITLTQHTSVAYWQLTSTQYIGASNSLPSSGFTVPIAGTGMIDWVGVGRKTIQGQYNDWTSVNQISGSASDHQHVYAIVVNPLQNNITTGSGLDVSSVANGIINITVDPAWSVKIYQLENQFSLGVDSNTQSGDTGTGTYDSNTGQWTYTNDQTGESFDQQFGGMTTPDSQFDSIHDFLENIANTISGFFSGAINAVSTLVGAGSSFFGVLGGLYSWLPPAVYSVLVSALIIVITIGVIKVFV